jgi:hypothetical protein
LKEGESGLRNGASEANSAEGVVEWFALGVMIIYIVAGK